eukprot:scaffold41220_cov71-Phaeocystis_antarctica.AAC.22
MSIEAGGERRRAQKSWQGVPSFFLGVFAVIESQSHDRARIVRACHPERVPSLFSGAIPSLF